EEFLAELVAHPELPRPADSLRESLHDLLGGLAGDVARRDIDDLLPQDLGLAPPVHPLGVRIPEDDHPGDGRADDGLSGGVEQLSRLADRMDYVGRDAWQTFPTCTGHGSSVLDAISIP